MLAVLVAVARSSREPRTAKSAAPLLFASSRRFMLMFNIVSEAPYRQVRKSSHRRILHHAIYDEICMMRLIGIMSRTTNLHAIAPATIDRRTVVMSE